VQSTESHGALGLEALIGSVPGGATNRDTLAVRDFILSRDMLAKLEQSKGLSKHYQNPAKDFWARLDTGASSEDTFEYYKDIVRVDHDSMSGVLTLRIRAFEPQYARALSELVLRESEKMVNQLSDRARSDQTRLAREEVKKAEARLSEARQKIVKLQEQHSEFSPEKTATEAFTLRGELKGELARARAELMEAKAFMQPNAPKVVALEERVRSLSAQVSEESRRLVSPKDGRGLNSSMADFDAAVVEKEFAQGAYQSALVSLEMSRSEASRQHRYLATISQPSLPNDETYPRRLRGVITVVVLSAMLLGIGALFVAAVREHARI
jgi:capsular polysaccharide transport system permease protein